jgi:hypothetical protein
VRISLARTPKGTGWTLQKPGGSNNGFGGIEVDIDQTAGQNDADVSALTVEIFRRIRFRDPQILPAVDDWPFFLERDWHRRPAPRDVFKCNI